MKLQGAGIYIKGNLAVIFVHKDGVSGMPAADCWVKEHRALGHLYPETLVVIREVEFDVEEVLS